MRASHVILIPNCKLHLSLSLSLSLSCTQEGGPGLDAFGADNIEAAGEDDFVGDPDDSEQVRFCRERLPLPVT
jgi:hypothetical protein